MIANYSPISLNEDNMNKLARSLILSNEPNIIDISCIAQLFPLNLSYFYTDKKKSSDSKSVGLT